MKPARDDGEPNDLSREAQDGTLVAARSKFAGTANAAGEGVAFARRYLWRSAEVLMYWMPVWIPLILLAQISSRGLSPALVEEHRLAEQKQILDKRLERDEARAHELDLKLEALDDEIYHERLLRLHRDEVREEIETRGLAPIPASLELVPDGSSPE